MIIAAFTIQQSYSAVHLNADGFADFSSLIADDLDLCTRCAKEQHLIQHDGIHDDMENTVQNTVCRSEGCLRHQNDNVECVQDNRYGDMQFLTEDNCRYIRTAC